MQPRRRRTSAQVREAILQAAQDLFAQNGYAGTSTRAISRHCGVAEPLIFRQFGSKAALFEAAVRAPFEEFLTEFAGTWGTTSQSLEDIQERSGVYVSGLYKRLMDNRKLLLAVIRGAQDDDAEIASLMSGPHSPLARYFDGIEEIAAGSMQRIGLHSVDVHIAVRATFAMVIGMAMCDEWLFPPDRHPEADRIIREMQQYMVHGLAHRD